MPIHPPPPLTPQAEEVFDGMAQRITPDMQRKVNAVVRWDITQGGKVAKTWVTNLKTGSVTSGGVDTAKPDCTMIMADDVLVAITSQKLSPINAFMQGKLKIKGNMGIAQRLQGLFATKSKL